MRLHELRLRAVGPFVDEQVIDFERLGASGLFLLEGPTGAGKTTVLDAITFALYGSVTGSAGDPGRLCSDFAAPDTVPLVCLEMSVRGGRVRLTRSPEHERPKKRGPGTTIERASAHLEVQRDGVWVSLSSRLDEIGGFVADELGLTREQFRQVVLLPQGEFAGFLRANDEGRREVLVRLFGTQFYERLARKLQERATDARRQLRDSESDLETRLALAWEASGEDVEPDPDRPLTWDQQVADLASVRDRAAERALAAGRQAEDAQQAEDAARRVAAEAQEVAARVAQRLAVVAERDALEGERVDHELRSARADQARRSRPLRPLLSGLDEARARTEQTLAQLDQLGLAQHAGEADTWARALRERASRAQRTVAGLSHVLDLERGLADQQARLADAEVRLSVAREQLAELERHAAELPERRQVTLADLAAARRTLEDAQRAGVELEAALRRSEAAAQQAAVAARLVDLRSAERAAKRRFGEASDEVDVVVAQRLAGVRGELAAALVSGEACLVCGSRQHPAPAPTDQALVAEAVMRQAEQARNDAAAAWEAARGSVATLEASLAAAAAVADGLTIEESERLVADLRARVAAGAKAEAQAARLAVEEADLAAAATQTQQALVRASASAATTEAEVGSIAAELAGARSQVEAHRSGHSSVTARCAALEAESGSALAAAAALEEHDIADRAAQHMLDSATAGAVGAGFADLQRARAAALDDAQLARLEQQMRVWEQRARSASSRLEQADLAAVENLTGEWAARVAEAAEALRIEATALARVRTEGAARARHLAQLLVQQVTAVRRAAEERARIAAAADEVIAVDEYVRGMAGNPRMTLSTFVLRYWFDQVVAAANVRLKAMSAGRYELVRVDTGTQARERVGLGLAVLDRHTGHQRGTGTLSGGETFYTSLSLALGLADVVVAEAGGAQLDTLFIDEGFGSLDTDTLDEVMTVIDELRGHGRVVGVVSHVAELNERIPERLSIRRVRPGGPSAVTVVA